MSAVVNIRGGQCRRKKNRPEDNETIRCRRIIASVELTAIEDENATALALSWTLARKLPCANLRLIAGTLDQRTDFQVRLAEVEIARAEREAFHARIIRTDLLRGHEAAKEMYPENERIFGRYRQAMLDMANTPVFTRRDLDRKKAAIGRVWLGAEGPWYDQLRAAVAADEWQLTAKAGGVT